MFVSCLPAFGPTASLASAFVASPLSLRAFATPSCSSARTCRVQPARMAADADADDEGKVSVKFRHLMFRVPTAAIRMRYVRKHRLCCCAAPLPTYDSSCRSSSSSCPVFENDVLYVYSRAQQLPPHICVLRFCGSRNIGLVLTRWGTCLV